METKIEGNNTASEFKKILSDKNNDYQVRSKAFYDYLETRDPNAFSFLKNFIDDEDEDEYLISTMISSLGSLEPKRKEIDTYLLQLLKEGRFKSQAIQALAWRGVDEAVPLIIEEILNSPDNYVRSNLAQDLRSKFNLSWKERLERMLDTIESLNIRPEAIDEEAIITAIIDKGSTLTKNKDHIIEDLIEKSRGQDKRMTGVYAKLIIELSSKSQSIAGQKISDVEKNQNIPSEQLRNLRIAIGGDTAIDPLMGILHENLETYFQTPIHELNTDTHQNWKKTIQYAQYGFMTRMIMSVVVFIIGILLLSISSYQFFWGDATGNELFGAGVSFVAGLGTMLTVVYSGPLRQIRESVNDLGIASAAFIAYVHRVLEISHTFSFYYLNQKITFDEMDKSSELIDKAMKNTVELLSNKAAKIDKTKLDANSEK